MAKKKEKFVPTKLHYLIVYLVRELKEIWRLELAKLIYLIDWENYYNHGVPITKAFYTRQKMGPLIAGLDRAVEKLKGWEVKIEQYKDFGLCHRPGSRPRFNPDFSKAELETVQRILSSYGRLDGEPLKELSYRTPLMLSIFKEERKVGKELLGKPIVFAKFPTRDPLQKYRKLAETVDFSEQGTEKELVREELAVYQETERLRKRANTLSLKD